MNAPIERRAQNRAMLWIVGAGALIMLIVATVLSTGAILIARDVNRNTNGIATTAAFAQEVERRDRTALRQTSYRICEREARDRAEQQLRAGLSPPAVIAKLVKQLGLPAKLTQQVSIEAVRQRLPIFDCTPNLDGLPELPLTDKQQKLYVSRYAAGKLAVTP